MLRRKWFAAALVAASAAVLTQTASAVPPTSADFNPKGRVTLVSGSATHAVTQVTLTVSNVGTGMGWVTSDPAGISCGTICSAQFPLGTTVTLSGQAGAGSMWAWHSTAGPDCTAVGPPNSAGPAPACTVLLVDNASVEWTFNLIPAPCDVPNVKGRTLRNAEQELVQDDCRPGTVIPAFSRRVNRGRVLSQSPPPRWQREHGAKVNLVVSKGRRQS